MIIRKKKEKEKKANNNIIIKSWIIYMYVIVNYNKNYLFVWLILDSINSIVSLMIVDYHNHI